MKKYKIKKTRTHVLSNRPDSIKEIEGTVEELISYFEYTLTCGNSWNGKINTKPKTIKSLINSINSINASYRETQRGYSSTYLQLIA